MKVMRKILDLSLMFCVALGLSLAATPAAADAPLAEKYLLDGKLAEGAKALESRLKEAPKDDQARFGLGVLQFLQTFEHLGGSLYKYGLRTEKAFLRPPPQVKEFLPQNRNPETLTYPAARQLIQTFIDDLVKAEATLAEVQDPAVKLPLHVGLIKIDPFGQGKPISAAFLFERIEGLPVTSQQAKELVIEAEQVLKGKKLISLWRGKEPNMTTWLPRGFAFLWLVLPFAPIMGATPEPRPEKRVAGPGAPVGQPPLAQAAKEWLTLKGHIHSVVSVAFSPDGKRLASS